VLQCIVSYLGKCYVAPLTIRVLQCVAVCCCVLQCVAVCCSVLQCVAVCCSVLQCVAVSYSVLQCVAVCRSVSWWTLRLSVRCSVVQRVAACCNESQHILVDATARSHPLPLPVFLSNYVCVCVNFWCLCLICIMYVMRI